MTCPDTDQSCSAATPGTRHRRGLRVRYWSESPGGYLRGQRMTPSPLLDLVAARWKQDPTTLFYVFRLEVALWEQQHSSSEASLARCAAFAEYGRRLLAIVGC